jgi:hypothetical protein
MKFWIFFAISLLPSASLSQTFEWGGIVSNLNSLEKIKSDQNGNIYVVSNRDSVGILLKFDMDGKEIWRKVWQGHYSIKDIAIRGNNLYMIGSFKGTFSFGFTSVVSAGLEDVFYTKLDLDGNPSWVKRIGGKETDNGNGIFVDNKSFLYITGFFSDTIFVNPNVFYSECSGSLFVCKADSFGTVQTAKISKCRPGSDDSKIVSEGIVVSDIGEIYVRAWVYEGGSIDTILLTMGSPYPNHFILKIDSNNTCKWLNSYPSTTYLNDLAIDHLGNPIISEYFNWKSDYSGLIAMYNPSGALLWENSLEQNCYHGDSKSLAATSSQNFVYSIGWLSPGYGYCYNSNKLLLLKHDLTGATLAYDTLATADRLKTADITTDHAGDVIITGVSSGEVNLGKIYFKSRGDTLFIAKIKKENFLTNLTSLGLNNLIEVFPNPTDGKINLRLNNAGAEDIYVSIINSLGEIVFIWSIKKNDSQKINEINLERYAPGMYTLVTQKQGHTFTKRFIIK